MTAPGLTNQWIDEQRARSEMAATVDTHTFRIALDNLQATMRREVKLREALMECEGYIVEVGQQQGEWEASLFAIIHEALDPSEASNG